MSLMDCENKFWGRIPEDRSKQKAIAQENGCAALEQPAYQHTVDAHHKQNKANTVLHKRAALE